ncbi:MAG: hypothetical protein BA863_03815 [Desulfovibrio sp. S3730MH75]|nr:MAG: hypothetical protein BA863_03815 [Desulfovibrio sp. S3730MH75]
MNSLRKYIIKYSKLKDFIFPIVLHVCHPRGEDDSSQYFDASCPKCGQVLDQKGLAYSASLSVSSPRYSARSCPSCGYDRLIVQLKGITPEDMERLREDKLFSKILPSRPRFAKEREGFDLLFMCAGWGSFGFLAVFFALLMLAPYLPYLPPYLPFIGAIVGFLCLFFIRKRMAPQKLMAPQELKERIAKFEGLSAVLVAMQADHAEQRCPLCGRDFESKWGRCLKCNRLIFKSSTSLYERCFGSSMPLNSLLHQLDNDEVDHLYSLLMSKEKAQFSEKADVGLKESAVQGHETTELENSSDVIKQIEEIFRAIDSSIQREYSNMAFNFWCEFDSGSSPPFIKQIDDLMKSVPNDPDVLFLKSEAHFAIMDGEIGLKYQKRTLDIDPDHFDAKMRSRYPEWLNVFVYPGWYDNIKSVPAISLTIQQENNMLQVVRDGLKVSMLVLVTIPADDLPGKIVDANWKPIWVNTKNGVAFFYYVVFKVSKIDKPAWLEFMIDPYPFDIPRSLDGYWLVQRLCRQDHIWIAFNDGEKLLYNKKCLFTVSEKSNFNKMKKHMSNLKRDNDSHAKFISAVQFHQHNYDPDSLLE